MSFSAGLSNTTKSDGLLVVVFVLAPGDDMSLLSTQIVDNVAVVGRPGCIKVIVPQTTKCTKKGPLEIG